MTTNHSNRPQDPTEAQEWERGYWYGFEDNRIPYWRRENYSRSFLLGYDIGMSELETLIEYAEWERQNYGWWL